MATEWLLFGIFVLVLLALDLGVFHRKDKAVSIKESLWWSLFWVLLAFLFNGWVWHEHGADKGKLFFAGYLIERAMSVDNLFVFLIIFTYFKVPDKYQYKILFWGILGALAFRAVFIWAGIELVEKFKWTMYLLGAFLVYTGLKMAFKDDDGVDPESNPVLKLVRKVVPLTPDYVGGKFFTRIDAKLFATPLFATLVFVEATDVVFAVDSIPAILAFTRDPFIIYTSNVFAILGLRALYFALAAVMPMFHYLKIGLSIILVFVGGKMIATYWDKHVPVEWSLSIIVGILAGSILLSMVRARQLAKSTPPPSEGQA